MPKNIGTILNLVSVIILISMMARLYFKLKMKNRKIIKQTKCVTEPKLDHNEEYDGDVRWIIDPEDEEKNEKN